MIEVTLIGKKNATFIVKDQKKIDMWKMLEDEGEAMFVKVITRKIKDKEKKE